MSDETKPQRQGKQQGGPAGRSGRAGRNLREVGAAGEDVAAAYFLERGYRLLGRNFFTARGEVDIILAGPDSGDGSEIVFVEVKWPGGGGRGEP
ncbi:MAG: YraN family protein [Corynebacterium sp.]|nr:YraN family protein [Corynebacterium sp.]